MDDVPYCWNSCGTPAVGESLEGLTIDGEEIVVLLCSKCLLEQAKQLEEAWNGGS